MALVAAVMLGVPTAQALDRPKLGLWEVQGQVLINGQDAFAQMRKNIEQEIAQQRARGASADQIGPLREMLKNLSSVDRECITPTKAAEYDDPKKLLARLEQDEPGCRFVLDSNTPRRIDFHGNCQLTKDDEMGFQGPVKGAFEWVSPDSWRDFYSGDGQVVLPPGYALPGIKAGAQRAMHFEYRASGRWLGPQCGAVKPQQR
jgi:hypothetical protein